MITKTKDLSKCYGCFACANICPKNCIMLKHDDEGFFMPQIDETICINCGACDRVCIIDKTVNDLVAGHKKKPDCYYGFLKNNTLRRRSASGGVAYALSEHCVKEGGVVFGVVGKWFEDVHHIAAENTEDLGATCMSKNIQSRVGNSYEKAKIFLNNGRKVVFTGTPCQIAGLYSYLGKDYDNLVTADLICHGVPSQKVLKAYIKKLEEKKGKKIVNFGRSNRNAYLPVQYIADYEDGSQEILMPEDSVYRKAFLSNLILRKSCSKCKFSCLPRMGDITMGDVMFSVGKRAVKSFDPDNLGTSLILANTEKGKKALLKVQEVLEYHQFELDIAIDGNAWVSHGVEKNQLRSEFFKVFLSEGFENAEPIMIKSYSNLWEKYRKNAKFARARLLLHPVKLIKKVKRKLFGDKEYEKR